MRLADGTCGVLAQPGHDSFVVNHEGELITNVPEAYRHTLTLVAQGIATVDNVDPLGLEFLRNAGVLDEGGSRVDPKVRARLRSLGDRVAWRIRDLEETGRLLEVVRDIHARRKLFVDDFGQTSCLPETAVARVALVRRSLAPGSRVLLIGDDDFLSVPLALEGFKVTVLDIDADLIAYLKVIAEEHGVTIDARIKNLLEPLEDSLLECADAVFTDPMSHVNGLSVFIGRALAVVRPGGKVFCCLHPLARRNMETVLADMPCHVEAIRGLFSSYYINGFADVDYSSDLLTLVRGDGDLPVAGTEKMPDIDVTLEELPYPAHGYCRILGRRLGAKKGWRAEDLSEILSAHDFANTLRFVHEDGRYRHFALDFERGGSASVMVDVEKMAAAFHLYPHHLEVGEALAEALEYFIGANGREYLYPYAKQLASLAPVFEGEA